jgi:anti-sigma factor (TIGR02949 family)
MRCDEVLPRLDAYLDGELPETERTPLRGHLKDCPDCGPEAAALERLRDDIRRSAPVHRAP